MSIFSLSKKLSITGAACAFSTLVMAQDMDGGLAPYRSDIITKIDTLTIVQLSDPAERPSNRVNLVNIFCPYNEMVREYAPEGGAATLEHGTMDELADALGEYTAKMEALGLGNDGVKGFAMSIIDTHGKIQPSYTFNQASRQAKHFHTDADLAGISPNNSDLIRQINQTYLTLCFGNS